MSITTHSRTTTTTPVDLREPLLSAGEVAGLLGVPRSSVYEYARRTHRRLPSVHIGRHRRFMSNPPWGQLEVRQRQSGMRHPPAEGQERRRLRREEGVRRRYAA